MISSLLITKNKQIIFTGDHLKIYIPKRYENRGLLVFDDIVRVLGIFEMEAFHSSLPKGSALKGLVCPAMLSTIPEEVNSVSWRGVDCFCFEYGKNQTIITSTTLIKQERLAYLIFMEQLSLGNLPKFLHYDDLAFMFDNVVKTTGANLNMNHSIFEMLYGQQCRDADNSSIRYRHTDMKKPPKYVELRSVSEAMDSTSARLYGSYAIDGLNSSLTTVVENQSDLENHLRG